MVVGALHDRDVRNIIGFTRRCFDKARLDDQSAFWRDRANPWPRIRAIVKARDLDIDGILAAKPKLSLEANCRHVVQAALAEARVFAHDDVIDSLVRQTPGETRLAVSSWLQSRTRAPSRWTVDRKLMRRA